MENIIYTVNLDFTDNGCVDTGWRLKQGDYGNSKIVVKLSNNGDIFYDGNISPQITFKRADGNSVVAWMTADASYQGYTYIIVGNELEIPGSVIMDLKVIDSEDRTSTASCKFFCVANPEGYDPEGTHTYVNSDLIANIAEDAEAALMAREDARTYATMASTAAGEAATSRNTAVTKASEASTSATASSNSKLDAEAWAVGTRNGQAVPSTDPAYNNNSKYWSQQSGQTTNEVTDARTGVDGSTYSDLGTSIRTQITKVNNQFKDALDIRKLFIIGGYIKTNDAVGTQISLDPISYTTLGYAIIPCKANDTFYINYAAGSAARRWCFVDTNRYILSQSSASSSVTSEIITASQDGYLIVNINTTTQSVNNSILSRQIKTGDVFNYYDLRKFIIEGYYFLTNGTIGTDYATGPNPLATNSCLILPCSNTQSFELYVAGGSGARRWAFIDNDYKLIAQSDANTNVHYEIVTAPDDGFIVVNINNSIISNKDVIIKTMSAFDYDALDIKFLGKRYAAIGDSITYGFGARNTDYYGTQIDSFPKLTARRMGMRFYNYGINSSPIANVAGWNGMCTRYTDMTDDADIVSVMGGVNDLNLNVPIGTFLSDDDTTFYGGLNKLFNGLYDKYFSNTAKGKDRKILVMTPLKCLDISASPGSGIGKLKELEPYVEAVKKTADYFSYPVLDLYNMSNMNPHLCRTLSGTTISGNFNPYMPDGTHPSKNGHMMLSRLLEGFIKSLD